MSLYSEERGYDFSQDDFRSFVSHLREKDPEKIDEILQRYSLYRPEMAEAALLVANEKSLISYELYVKLIEYVRINFSNIAQSAREQRWARNNAFREYVKAYDDERIWEILEDRSDIAKDIYLAILEEAVERGLIEKGEKDRLYRELRNSEKTYFQRRREAHNIIFNGIFHPDKPESVPQPEQEDESEKYWTCPACRESVPMNLARCWNCDTPDPENP